MIIASPLVDSRAHQGVTLRRATRRDADAVAEMLGALSSQTRYLRYYTPRPLTGAAGRREAERITHAPPPHAFALLALAQREGREIVVGVAELVRDERALGIGEAALLVHDDWQRRGVGSLLAAGLLQLARASAIDVLRAITLPENRAIPRLVKRLGVPYRITTRPGEVQIEMASSGFAAEPILAASIPAPRAAAQAGV